MLKNSAVNTASFRFCKAQRDYSAARQFLEAGQYDAAIDRAFLCMFHAARALLFYDNIDLKKPDDVIRSFHDQYILQSYHDPRLCEMFEQAKTIRSSGIFSDDYLAHVETAKQQVKNAEYFLEATGTISGRRLALEYEVKNCLEDSGVD